MVIFYTMMNLARINSLIVYLGNDLQPFLRRLAHELIVPELMRRSLKKIGIPSSLQIHLRMFRPICDDDYGGKSSLPPPKRHKCMACTVENGIRRLTKIKYLPWIKSICLSRANHVCNECKIAKDPTSFDVPGSCVAEVE